VKAAQKTFLEQFSIPLDVSFFMGLNFFFLFRRKIEMESKVKEKRKKKKFSFSLFMDIGKIK
jgi:hypothetical protein